MVEINPDLLKKISYGDLDEISLERYEQNEISLNFVLSGGGEALLSAVGIALFSFSKSFEDDGCYVMGSIDIIDIKNTDYEVLQNLNYGFFKNSKPYLDAESAKWVHIEGFIVMDIICSGVSIEEKTR